jgi:hypothetical protein
MLNVNANSTAWIQKIVVTMLLPQAMEEDWCGKKDEPQASSPCLKEGARHLGHDTT